MTTVDPAVSAEDALQLLTEAARKARELQRELDLIAPRNRMHSFRALRWGVTVPTGNYSSARLDAEVLVDADQRPEEVLRELKSWVGLQAPVSVQDLEEMAREAMDRREELRKLDNLIKEATAKWRTICTVFERLGIPIPSDVSEDLPF